MRALICGTLLFAAAVSANAATLFQDGFESYGTPGTSDLNFTGFGGNWTVSGNVDLVQSGEYGITCSGKCVDLDGTSGPGGLLSKPIAFSAGNRLTVQFSLSGNQRGGGSDQFAFDGLFSSPTDLLDFYVTSGFTGAPFSSGDFFGQTTLGGYGETIAPGRPFLTYAFSFTPGQSGTLQLSFSTPSRDNVGPLLDSVSVSAVPEPASWAMLIVGFGLVGATLRRRAVARIA